jgi:prepilin-type processing-associated H-X9-DG protein
MLYACPDPAAAQLQRLPCNTFEEGTSRDYLSAAARSWHPGGVNVVFLDGRVAFLPEEVDQFAMAFMVCINDGRPVATGEHTY